MLLRCLQVGLMVLCSCLWGGFVVIFLPWFSDEAVFYRQESFPMGLSWQFLCFLVLSVIFNVFVWVCVQQDWVYWRLPFKMQTLANRWQAFEQQSHDFWQAELSTLTELQPRSGFFLWQPLTQTKPILLWFQTSPYQTVDIDLMRFLFKLRLNFECQSCFAVLFSEADFGAKIYATEAKIALIDHCNRLELHENSAHAGGQ